MTDRPEIPDIDKGQDTGTRSTTPAEPQEESKAAVILKAACDVFAETGYAAARMDDVAKRAGVAKGLIYFYYKNKEKLFEAVIKGCITTPLSRAFTAGNPAESMAKRLVKVTNHAYANMASAPFFFHMLRLVLLEGNRFPNLHQYYYEEVLLPVMKLFQECLAEGARRGEWQENDIPRYVHFVIAPGIVMSMWRMAMNHYQKLDMADYMRENQRFLLRSLRLDDDAIEEAMKASDLVPRHQETVGNGRTLLKAEPLPAGKNLARARAAARRRRPTF